MGGHDDGLMDAQMGGLLCKLEGLLDLFMGMCKLCSFYPHKQLRFEQC
jgi:hypothetical protein